MHARIIETVDEFRALRTAWNRLARSRADLEPFDLWEWAFTACETCLEGRADLFIVVLEEGRETKAIAPLCIQRVGGSLLGGKALRMINGDHADYGAFLLDPKSNHHDLLKQIFGTLFEHRDRWDVVHLLNFSSRNPQTFLVAEIAGSEFGSECLFSEQVVTPYFRFGGNEDKVDAKEARNLRRRERNLHRDHEVEIAVGGAFDEEFWDAFLAFHLSKWPESIFRDERNRRFFRRLVPLFESMGMAELSRMRIDGEMAALHLGFKTDRKICYYIPVYSAKHARDGAGGILLKHIIDHYAADKEEFDFLRGNEAYKFTWTDLVAANHNLLLDNGRARGRLIRRFVAAKDHLRRIGWLKWIYDAAKKGLAARLGPVANPAAVPGPAVPAKQPEEPVAR